MYVIFAVFNARRGLREQLSGPHTVHLPPYDARCKPCLHSWALAINPSLKRFVRSSFISLFLPPFFLSFLPSPTHRIARAPGQRNPLIPFPVVAILRGRAGGKLGHSFRRATSSATRKYCRHSLISPLRVIPPHYPLIAFLVRDTSLPRPSRRPLIKLLLGNMKTLAAPLCSCLLPVLLPTYLHSYLLSYLPTYLYTYLPPYLLTYFPMYLYTSLPL